MKNPVSPALVPQILVAAIAAFVVPAATATASQPLPGGGANAPAILITAQDPPAVKVEQGWVRATVPGQQGTGGYMKITAKKKMRLVGIASPAAGVAEVHEMKMAGDRMTMRPLAGGLDLPAGKTVELRPGGLHLMLMDLKHALPANGRVALTLLLRDENGVSSRLETQLEVRSVAPADAVQGQKH